MFVSIPGGDVIYAVLGLVIFAGYTMYDFQRLRRADQIQAAPLLAASIFLDVFNVFMLLLSLFGGGGRRLTPPARTRVTTQRRPHAARAVVGERAPEPIAPARRRASSSPVWPGCDDADPVGARAADAAEGEVVVVLAEVDELDDRRAAADRCRARARG